MSLLKLVSIVRVVIRPANIGIKVEAANMKGT